MTVHNRGALLPQTGYDATRCPRCGRLGGIRTRVVDTAGYLIRYRSCSTCRVRWRTVEMDVRWTGRVDGKGRRRLAALLERKEYPHE